MRRLTVALRKLVAAQEDAKSLGDVWIPASKYGYRAKNIIGDIPDTLVIRVLD